MKAYRSMEMVYELIDLASDIVLNTKQQLAYYKVSVYKNEEAEKIKESITDLQGIIDVIQNEDMKEAFLDYEATAQSHLISPSGESCFYVRTLKLINTISDILNSYSLKLKGSSDQDLNLSSALSFQQKKKSLLSRYRRRSGSFIQDI